MKMADECCAVFGRVCDPFDAIWRGMDYGPGKDCVRNTICYTNSPWKNVDINFFKATIMIFTENPRVFLPFVAYKNIYTAIPRRIFFTQVTNEI